MADHTAVAYLEEARRNFRSSKRLAEGAMAQLRDQEFFFAPDAESNSVALIVQHMAGNMRSRWTDFLTGDGEKPDRNRDREFILDAGATQADVMRWWEQGWSCVFDALGALQPEDVARTIYIRGQAHTVLQAINRQLTHYAYHVGQVVFLAKHIRGGEWKSLSIPKGQSAAFNAGMAKKQS